MPKLVFRFAVNDNLLQWLSFSKSCRKFKDTCLNQAKQRSLHKPKFEILYDATVSDNNKKLTKKASLEVEQAIFNQSGWEQTLSKLNRLMIKPKN